MDTTFATTYTNVVGGNEEVHHAVQDNYDRAKWHILLDPRFKAYWDYDHEYVEYVARLWDNGTNPVDLVGFANLLAHDYRAQKTKTTTTTLSIQGVRFSVTATYQGDDIRLVVHGTNSQYAYDNMLEMVFTLPSRSSVVNGLYPGPMLRIQGVPHPGRFLLHLVDVFNEFFGMESSRLIDISKKEMCSGSSAVSVPLTQLFLLARGSSWYMGHGFFPRDDTGTIISMDYLDKIRAMSMHDFYGTKSREILSLSGLPGQSIDFATSIVLGGFFELVCDQLFMENKITCAGILTILDMTKDIITALGHDIMFVEFVKRYDCVEAIPLRRVHRTLT